MTLQLPKKKVRADQVPYTSLIMTRFIGVANITLQTLCPIYITTPEPIIELNGHISYLQNVKVFVQKMI